MANDANEKLPAPIAVAEGGMVLKTMSDLGIVADSIHRSGMAPKSLDSAAKVAVAILTGAEAGLSPMMAVRSIYVVNGAPAWLSRAARALVQNSGLLKEGTIINEGVRHAPGCAGEASVRKCLDLCEGFCNTWRNRAMAPREHTFTVARAKHAGLWNKKGPWQEYPDRMLMHRAAGFHFDDCWSDVLMGLTTIEVLQDYPQAAFVRDGESIAAIAEPPGRDPLLGPASFERTVQEAVAGTTAKGEDAGTVPAEPAVASEEVTPSEINLGAPRDTLTAAEVDAGIVNVEQIDAEPEAATDPMDEPLPPRYVADEEEALDVSGTIARDNAAREMEVAEEGEKGEKGEKPKKKATRKKKPVPDQQAPFIATCSVDGCGKEFDPDREVHWNHEGVFRCSSCGQFPK